jgi:nonsense-mediated mRNA decay protein 3
MKKLTCPVCGRLADHEINGLCSDCFLKTVTLASIPHVIHTTICSVCGAVKSGHRWFDTGTTIDELIKADIIKALKISQLAENTGISIRLTSSDPFIYHADIRINANIKGINTGSNLETEVRIIRETCTICSRIAGGYYEAIIQIRADGRFADKEEQARVLDLAYEIVEHQYRTGNRMAFITKINELPEGTDIYIGSTSTARQICKIAGERFGSRYSDSPTLAGRKDGEDIYRVTYSLRLPRFISGDIIRVSSDVVLIRSSGKRTSGIYLRSGQEFLENTNRLKSAKKIADIKNAVSTVLISVEGDTVQVMHPETYRPVTIIKPAYVSGTGGEEVCIIAQGEDIFILPPE